MKKLKPEGYKCPAIFPKPESLGATLPQNTEANLDLILLQKGYKQKKERRRNRGAWHA